MFESTTLVNWSPAPEDIENKVADIQTDLQNAINNARALIAAEAQNRINTDKRVDKVVSKTNFLSDTQIDGNVVTTGTMIVGNSLGVQAGITGVGAANNDVRLWAGSNYINRANAPFHVLQDGTLHATNAHISGHVEAKSGQIGNETTGIKIGKKDGDITIGGFSERGGMFLGTPEHSDEKEIILKKTEGEGFLDNYTARATGKKIELSVINFSRGYGIELTPSGMRSFKQYADNTRDYTTTYTGSFNIPLVKLTVQVTNGIITSVTPYQ